MNKKFQFNDFQTELFFSLLRWFFLIIISIIFYTPKLVDVLNINTKSFPILMVIGIIYMTATQISLYKISDNNQVFKWITRCGIFFDLFAYIWILILTGGVTSPFIPIGYLVIMHATIYWSRRGAIFSFIAVFISYTMIGVFVGQFNEIHTLLVYIFNASFMLVIGLFGAVIAYRERSHFKEKMIFHELVFKDYLTGLYNHRTFQQELNKLNHGNEVFYLAMFDIDHFKQVNDIYGHTVGDKVLRDLGKILLENLSPEEGIPFRYGGEEFTILFYTEDINQVKQKIKEIIKKLRVHVFEENDHHFQITLSFGVCSSHRSNLSDELVKKADSLLYSAKNMGRDRAVFDDGTYINNERE